MNELSRTIKKLSILFALLCSLMISEAQTIKYYTNPILTGFYPDPSICRVGNDYYLVNSTFAYFPGIPVFHSKDLVNWRLIGHVMSRNEQMDLRGMGTSRAIFAPTIRYHDGLFYVTCTLVDGKGNFVVTAKDPAGPWSNPVWLPEINGIDPSPFFDDDGKAYIVYNSIPPGNQPLYDGHRTLRINEFDPKTLKISSDNRILVNGGTDISQKPSWIEGPHLIKKYGYYYLVAAEGGTYENHSVVAFRSKTLEGPFVPYEKNPILTQRHLSANRKHPITSVGHADLVELPNGEWQAVFLATRPYEGNHYNTGRETFLAPVKWMDEWPHISPGNEEVQYQYPLPLPEKKLDKHTYSGNFTLRDEFTTPQLHPDWFFLRNPEEAWYSLKDHVGAVALRLRPETCMGTGNPSFIARRQQHQRGEASTGLSFVPAAPNEKAGLLVFQNEDHFYYLCQSVEAGKPVVQLYQSVKDPKDSTDMKLLASQPVAVRTGNALQLKIASEVDTYAFYYSGDGKKWELLKMGVDARWLSTQTGGGFVGCVFALYASSHAKESNTKATYHWFEYRGNDEVFRKK
jgi:xylan 1,4-beta-xylosidase